MLPNKDKYAKNFCGIDDYSNLRKLSDNISFSNTTLKKSSTRLNTFQGVTVVLSKNSYKKLITNAIEMITI